MICEMWANCGFNDENLNDNLFLKSLVLASLTLSL